MKNIIFAFAVALMIANSGIAGSISGTVSGSDASSVTGFVVATNVPTAAPDPRLARHPSTATISSNGTFEFGPLPLGQYELCAQSPLTSWLGSCEWDGAGTIVNLTQDQPSTTVSIVLTKGAAINVRISDPTGLLSANEGITAGAHLLVGVPMPNMVFRLASIVSQDAAGRTYQILVPFERSVSVTVGSSFFQLSDATGKVLPKLGNRFPVLVPSGQQPPTLALNLTGTALP